MTHQTYQERLEEIIEIILSGVTYDFSTDKKLKQEAAQTFTQLCEDVVKAVIGEEDLSHRIGFGGAVMGLTHADMTRNNLRQTQHQTANLILKGE